MIRRCSELPPAARKRELGLAIQRLELNLMYYEQKGRGKGAVMSRRCIDLLEEHLASLP